MFSLPKENLQIRTQTSNRNGYTSIRYPPIRYPPIRYPPIKCPLYQTSQPLPSLGDIRNLKPPAPGVRMGTLENHVTRLMGTTGPPKAVFLHLLPLRSRLTVFVKLGLQVEDCAANSGEPLHDPGDGSPWIPLRETLCEPLHVLSLRLMQGSSAVVFPPNRLPSRGRGL